MLNKIMLKLFAYVGSKGFFKWVDDRKYLKWYYEAVFGKKLDLENPKSFNEKLQWLKLNNRKEEYSRMVDKSEVKKYVANIIGEEYIIPTYGVWNDLSEIDFEMLPNQFVIKCTHDSGGVVLVRDKDKVNRNFIQKKIGKSLKKNFYWCGREWPYQNVIPRVIVEEYMFDIDNFNFLDIKEKGKKTRDLNDYKFFCFGGDVKFFKIDFDRFDNHRANYYDMDMQLLPFGEAVCPPDANRHFDKPDNFNDMVEMAAKLSKDIPFLRVDFYNLNGKIYFGELTFFPASGFGQFVPEEWDEKIGELIKLPNEI